MAKRQITDPRAYKRNAKFGASFLIGERKNIAHERAQLCFQISMPLDDDAISALSMCELPVRAAGYARARAAERVAQREAAEMMTGTAATDDDLSFYAEKMHASETVIQKLNKEIASLVVSPTQVEENSDGQ